MHKYKVTIELESDACFGAGSSQNGLVNTEVLLDDFGYPYLLGKTFKGVLREAIDNILYLSLDAEEVKIINGWLGEKNYSKNKEKEENSGEKGSLKFSNFRLNADTIGELETIVSKFRKPLEDELRADFNKSQDKDKEYKDLKKSNKEKISSFRENVLLPSIMSLETSTKMDDENNVADKGSLRTIRILKKGLKFVGIIDIDSELSSNDKSLLELCLKAINHIGTNKTRGKGKVNISLDSYFQNDSQMIETADGSIILYEIDLEEPVKLVSNGSSYDLEDTNKYIPGSAIRGAIINGLGNITNEVLSRAIFLNAYPKVDVKELGYSAYGLPVPNIFRVSKADSKINNSKRYYKQHSEGAIKNNEKFLFTTVLEEMESKRLYTDKNRVTKYEGGEFCFEKDAILYTFNVDTEEHFHHTHGKDRENIYRYNAISRGQKYYGIIDLSKMDKEKNDLLKHLKNLQNLWIGGSRNSGYGKVKFKIENSFKDMDAAVEFIGLKKSDESELLYCYTDIALDNNESIDLDGSSADMSISTGYNAYWGARSPMTKVISKGSVLKTKDSIKSKELTCHKQEGYGCFIKSPSIINVNCISSLENTKVRDFTKTETVESEYRNMEIEMGDLLKIQNHVDLEERYIKPQKGSSNLNIKNICKQNAIQFYINEDIAAVLKNGDFMKYRNSMEYKLGQKYKSSINELIRVIEQSIFTKSDEPISSWMENKEAVSCNREQVVANRRLLRLELINNYSISELLSSRFTGNEHANSYSEGLNINLSGLVDKVKKIFDLEDADRSYIVRMLVREVLYYTINITEKRENDVQK